MVDSEGAGADSAGAGADSAGAGADSAGAGDTDLVIEDITIGSHASGFGLLGDGRPFSFRVHRGRLTLEIYRARTARPVPLPDDVVAGLDRDLGDFTDLDLDDEASITAAVRRAVAAAVPVRER